MAPSSVNIGLQPPIDWEDIAADDEGHLYVGDIGNNGGLLAIRAIYRIDEPNPEKAATAPAHCGRLVLYGCHHGQI